MAELEPCPFCGSGDVCFRKGIMYNGAVHCNNCGADVIFEGVALECEETGRSWQEAEAVRWNRRTYQPEDIEREFMRICEQQMEHEPNGGDSR